MIASLYYDGDCPLCRREISLLKRLTHGRVDFVDIHKLNDPTMPDKSVLLKRLHLHKANGEWLLGLDANVYVWSQTPYGVIFKLLGIWPVRPIADWIYTRWADRRFKKRYQCGRCSI